MLIHSQKKRIQQGSSFRNITIIMTINALGIFLRRDASQAFVRALTTGRTMMAGHRHRAAAFTTANFNRFNIGSFANRNLMISERLMSTAAATDEELDSALDEILGETESVSDEKLTTDNELDSALDDILGETAVTDEKLTTDDELDSALDDILGEALAEAENPAAMEGEGHIEGSHPFPKELVEEVRSIFVLEQFWIETC